MSRQKPNPLIVNKSHFFLEVKFQKIYSSGKVCWKSLRFTGYPSAKRWIEKSILEKTIKNAKIVNPH